MPRNSYVESQGKNLEVINIQRRHSTTTAIEKEGLLPRDSQPHTRHPTQCEAKVRLRALIPEILSSTMLTIIRMAESEVR
jgi:hypothetical protein